MTLMPADPAQSALSVSDERPDASAVLPGGSGTHRSWHARSALNSPNCHASACSLVHHAALPSPLPAPPPVPGTMVGSCHSAYETFFPHPSWAEQRCEDWWRAIGVAVKV